ncbi:hypothetical protein RFI_03285 [Reticulomyxa filosa]|uniref:Uncharacterized protein n=1 Tax=Reticulomyxa filosa TaxID=46433 RepID=X6P859_RETFI|nr:hypothetical protein RFI_03285 [Reticulomyxa filosa]|eukprot:ETO33817.1 hypothetical protein RFI_03285 [Reticulomyxa filosa]
MSQVCYKVKVKMKVEIRRKTRLERKRKTLMMIIIVMINIITNAKPKKKESESESKDNDNNETKDPEPLALTNCNEIEQIFIKGDLKVKKAIECIQIRSRLAVFKDDFKYKDQVDSNKTYCLNIQQAAVEIFEVYGTMGTNFLMAQTIVQWKPQKVDTIEAKMFWEGVICACNEVVNQLMNTIRLGAGFQQALAEVRFGKFKEYQNKVGQFVEKTEKEVDKKTKKNRRKKKFRKKEEETSKKIEEIMKRLAKNKLINVHVKSNFPLQKMM